MGEGGRRAEESALLSIITGHRGRRRRWRRRWRKASHRGEPFTASLSRRSLVTGDEISDLREAGQRAFNRLVAIFATVIEICWTKWSVSMRDTLERRAWRFGTSRVIELRESRNGLRHQRVHYVSSCEMDSFAFDSVSRSWRTWEEHVSWKIVELWSSARMMNSVSRISNDLTIFRHLWSSLYVIYPRWMKRNMS